MQQTAEQGTYQTSGEGQFKKNYRQNAILQKGFNASLVEDTVQFVLRTMPDAINSPIRILDLCCGNGDFTIALLERLSDAGIQVGEIVGYDISNPQIATANIENAPRDARAKFYAQDVATMEDKSCFDLVVSYFGLHWLPDTNNAVHRIADALKPGGKLVFFVPLEKMQLFHIRDMLRQSDSFQGDFGSFELSPFKESPAEYTDALSGFFTLENPKAISCQILLEYSQEQFNQFLQSWMPELRTVLSDEKRSQEYLNKIWQSIPIQEPDDACPPSLAKDTSGTRLRFFERGLWLHASANTDIDLALEDTCVVIKSL